MDTFFINQQNCHSINKIAISTPKSTLAALVRHSAIHLLPPSQEEPHPPPIPCPSLSIPTHREGNWYLTSDLLPKPDKASLHANNVLSDQLHFSCNKATYSSVAWMLLPGASQGQGSLVGFRLWGRTESDTTEVT